MSEDWQYSGDWKPRTKGAMKLSEMNGAITAQFSGDNRVHMLNPTGAFLLELCNGAHGIDEMVTIVQQAFSLDYLPVKEVKDFLRGSIHEGILV